MMVKLYHTIQNASIWCGEQLFYNYMLCYRKSRKIYRTGLIRKPHIRKPTLRAGGRRWEYERNKIRKPQARNQTYRLREMRKGMALWQCKILWYVRGKIKGNPREEFPLISYLLIRFSAIRTAFVFHTFTKWTAWWTFANHGLTAHCAILLHINRIRGLT